MAAKKTLSEFNDLRVEQTPDFSGVYELLDEQQNVIYIAGAPTIRKALRDLRKANDARTQKARYFRYEVTFSAAKRAEALLEEYKKEHGGKLPVFNVA